MTHSFQPIFPPDCLGILGGGQLGRFFVQAAQDLGFTVCVLDPDSQSLLARFLTTESSQTILMKNL